MTKSIRVDRDIPMKMRDGITLKADVYRPDDKERHPAIVVRTPYNKIPSAPSDFLSPVEAAFAGYAMIIQDTRGRSRKVNFLSAGRRDKTGMTL